MESLTEELLTELTVLSETLRARGGAAANRWRLRGDLHTPPSHLVSMITDWNAKSLVYTSRSHRVVSLATELGLGRDFYELLESFHKDFYALGYEMFWVPNIKAEWVKVSCDTYRRKGIILLDTALGKVRALIEDTRKTQEVPAPQGPTNSVTTPEAS